MSVRPLESALLAAIVLTWLLGLFTRQRPALLGVFLGACAIGVLLALAHLLVEGGRWQMMPAYTFSVALAVAALLWRRRGVPAQATTARWRTGLRWTGTALAGLALAAATLLPAMFPVNVLPQPTGPMIVGVTRFHLTDQGRGEPLTPDADDQREVEVLAWHPAARGGTQAPLWGDPRLIGRELARGLGLPSFIFSHLRLSPSHAFADAPVVGGGPFPTVIFSHGYAQGFAAQNSALFEELASRGYVVLALNHPYEGLVSTRSGGEVVRGDKSQIARVSREVGNAFPLIRDASQTADPAVADAKIQQAMARMPVASQQLALWTGDIRLVASELPRLARSGPLAGAVDLNRVGTMGMSFGASAATEACAELTACKAAVNLDGTPIGRVALSGTTKPVLFMTSDNPNVAGANRVLFRRTGPDSRYVTLKGSSHLDYSDLTLVSPLFRWLGVLGPIGGERATRDTRRAVTTFLDRHLAGKLAEQQIAGRVRLE